MPEIAVMDEALPPELADAILAHAIAHEADFRSTTIGSRKERVDSDYRASLWCPAGLGPCESPFKTSMENRFADLCRVTGTTPFAQGDLEIELVAHRDGHFYRQHIDTGTNERGGVGKSPRMLSCVLYLHRQPRVFSGGGIRFKAIVGDSEKVLEPRHNRMVAFPAYAPHEVLPTQVPGNAFADARFSVNCWFHANPA